MMQDIVDISSSNAGGLGNAASTYSPVSRSLLHPFSRIHGYSVTIAQAFT